MNVSGYVTGAAKACTAAVKAIDDLVRWIRSAEKRDAIVKSVLGGHHTPRASALLASLIYGREITYADVLYNIVFMVEIRKGMVMRLERALAKDTLTQDEINGACQDIYYFVRDLEMSIRQLHALLAQINDSAAVNIPISLGVTLAETRIYSDELISELKYDEKTGNNNTDIFSNPAKRVMLQQLCVEMNRMIDLLCKMKIAPVGHASTAAPKPSPNRRKQSKKRGGNRDPLLSRLVAEYSDSNAFRKKVIELGYGPSDEELEEAFRRFQEFPKTRKMYVGSPVDEIPHYLHKELIEEALTETITSSLDR